MSSVFRRSPGAALHSVTRGEGVWLWDTQGHRSLDGCSGAVVVNVGHGRAEVVDAMARQGRNIAYVHNGEFTSQALEELGARLAALAPRGLDRIYPVSGRSEATDPRSSWPAPTTGCAVTPASCA
jgi:adenosylmethionine-8-amino-7-oxononanoate aminotransferase